MACRMASGDNDAARTITHPSSTPQYPSIRGRIIKMCVIAGDAIEQWLPVCTPKRVDHIPKFFDGVRRSFGKDLRSRVEDLEESQRGIFQSYLAAGCRKMAKGWFTINKDGLCCFIASADTSATLEASNALTVRSGSSKRLIRLTF